jgi:branched-chain amino acid aminotransferase
VSQAFAYAHRYRIVVGTQNTIGISPPDSALLFVICSPVGPYYPDGFKPVALHGTTEYVRAHPGGWSRSMKLYPSPPTDKSVRSLGTGEYKIGANYAPGVLPQKQAGKLGYVQNLWLAGPEHNLTEVRIATPSGSVGCR